MVIGVVLIAIISVLGLGIFLQAQSPRNPVVVTNDVILPKGPGDYMEVRYIVIKGTNAEIGKALGDIGQSNFGAMLSRYTAPANSSARNEYIRIHYPVLWERMQGVAASYGIQPGNDTIDTSALGYGFGPAACSMIFFPGNTTTTGHAIYARNMDYFTATASEIFGTGPTPSGEKMCSKNFVLELYPDRGYPSIVIGSFDLLNGVLDGMNEKGVTVSLLVDNDAAPIVVADISQVSGLSSFQLMREVLDTASDVGEAQRIILNNNVSMLGVPLHVLVADRSGRSFVAELSADDRTWHFTDNGGKPQVLTNHALYKYPNTSTFPSVPATDEYDSFNRYRKLDAFVTNHTGKFSPADASSAMALVYANTALAMEGGSPPLPMRTVWTTLFDLEDRSVTVQFYEKDSVRNVTTHPSGLVFSQPYTFRLNRSGRNPAI
jgi:predicted choloylglycine hydrolase